MARYGSLVPRRSRSAGGCRLRAVAASELRAAARARRLAAAPGGVEAAPVRAPGTGDRDRAVAGGHARARRAPQRRRSPRVARDGRSAQPDVPDHRREDRARGHSRRTCDPRRPSRTGTPARATAAPKIAWHRATSVGLPYGGSLIDGTQLPIEGPNWVTWDPVTDSVPNLPHRLYGNERTIRTILRVTAAYRAAHPKAPRVVIGDISREGGGPMTDEHVSHQNGLDVDVYFPRRDHLLRSPTSTDQIDRRLAQDLLDRFVAAGAQMVFVGFSTGLHGPRASSSRMPGTRTTCTSASRRPAASPQHGRRRRHRLSARRRALLCEGDRASRHDTRECHRYRGSRRARIRSHQSCERLVQAVTADDRSHADPVDRVPPVELSIVVCVLDEEAAIDAFVAAVDAVLPTLGVDGHEYLFVDDGSSDGTWERIRVLGASRTDVVGVRLLRNVGKENALAAGLAAARGDVHVPMDVDLQDPPEVLAEPRARVAGGAPRSCWHAGGARDDSRLRKAAAFFTYRMLERGGGVTIPRDVGDFRLMTRATTNRFLALPERSRYNKGLLALVTPTRASWTTTARLRGRPTRTGRGRRSPSSSGSGRTRSSRSARGRSRRSAFSASSCSGCRSSAPFSASFSARPTFSRCPARRPSSSSLPSCSAFRRWRPGILGLYVAQILTEVKRRPLFSVVETFGLLPERARRLDEGGRA